MSETEQDAARELFDAWLAALTNEPGWMSRGTFDLCRSAFDAGVAHGRAEALEARIAELRTHLDWMMAHVLESRPDDDWLKIMLRQALSSLEPSDRG